MTDTKPKLLITRKLPDAVLDRAGRDYDARLNADDVPHGPEKLVAMSAGMEGILTAPGDPLTAQVIAGLDDSVRVIATFSVGYEHIDVDAAKARGISVTNTPGVLTESTAEIAMLLLLGAARRASEGEPLVRTGGWRGWAPTHLLGVQVSGKRLGIVGMGRIGRAVAHRAGAFGMAVLYHNRNRLPAGEEDGATFYAALGDMLGHCDFLSLHCPVTPETQKLLNARTIAKLPDGAIVVNTARGAVVDDTALIDALKSGKVAAAGLDVYEGEPNVAPGYLGLANTFLLPHLGSATIEARNAMGFKALDNLDAFFGGVAAPDRVA